MTAAPPARQANAQELIDNAIEVYRINDKGRRGRADDALVAFWGGLTAGQKAAIGRYIASLGGQTMSTVGPDRFVVFVKWCVYGMDVRF